MNGLKEILLSTVERSEVCENSKLYQMKCIHRLLLQLSDGIERVASLLLPLAKFVALRLTPYLLNVVQRLSQCEQVD